MGALHAGHRALLDRARAENDFVVASVFVNPLQFDRADDLAAYPRTLDADVKVCADAGVDVVFAPGAGELYPEEQLAVVEVPRLTRFLCGEFRPGHFRGVATVVLKLLNLVQPDRAYFGEKDAQQLAVIRRLVRDLAVPVTIVGVETVREPDGLALSSRNARLTVEERAAAPMLYRALRAAARALDSGDGAAARAKQSGLAVLAERPEARVEYFEVVDAELLEPVADVGERALIAGAVWLGNTRLIDNMTWRAGGGTGSAVESKERK
jgi:pantoate--beta-alanine ligase